ncbi:MAG: glycosyltransferase [bacterium]
MKLNRREKQLVKEFDQVETTLVISHWPVGKSFDGIATYTEDLVTKFAKVYNHKFVVMVPYEWKGSRVKLVSKNILLVGVFEENKIHLYPQILGWLVRFSKAKQVVVHSEFCASGGLYVRAMVVPFLALIKLTGRKITYYAHNVAEDLGDYAKHLGMKQGISLDLTKYGYVVYLKALRYVVDKFVVLEDSVEERLKKVMGNNISVVVAPHWIEKSKTNLSKNSARKFLGLSDKNKIVVSFGFISWYKGADVVVEAATNVPKSYQLVLAGGMATSLKDKDYYRGYYRDLSEKARNTSNVRITGFLSDKEVECWLRAADLIIMPYRLSMGGSGALQKAIEYGQAVLMSEAIESSLKEKWPISFMGDDPRDLGRVVKKYFASASLRKEVKAKVKELRSSRLMGNLLPEHYKQVYRTEEDRRMLEWRGEENKQAMAMVKSQ